MDVNGLYPWAERLVIHRPEAVFKRLHIGQDAAVSLAVDHPGGSVAAPWSGKLWGFGACDMSYRVYYAIFLIVYDVYIIYIQPLYMQFCSNSFRSWMT